MAQNKQFMLPARLVVANGHCCAVCRNQQFSEVGPATAHSNFTGVRYLNKINLCASCMIIFTVDLQSYSSYAKQLEIESWTSRLLTKDTAWDADNYRRFASRQITQYKFTPHETSSCGEVLFYHWGNGMNKFVWHSYDRPPYELAMYYGMVRPQAKPQVRLPQVIVEEVMIGDVKITV